MQADALFCKLEARVMLAAERLLDGVARGIGGRRERPE